MITCPPVPEAILVTLSLTMVNAMYKNLCTIRLDSGTIPELLRPNADEVYAILQNFGRTYYDCAGWQNDPSLNPLLFDPTFLKNVLHRVTRVRSRNYLRELETPSGNLAGDNRSPPLTGIYPSSTVIPTIEHSPNVRGFNHGTTVLGTTNNQIPIRYTGTVSSNSSTTSASRHSTTTANARVPGGTHGDSPTPGPEGLALISDRRDLLFYPSTAYKPATYPTSEKFLWDGRERTSWRTFESNLHAWALQTQMGYMFGTEDLQGHLRGGYTAIEGHIKMTIHPYQYNHDLGHLYGAIKQATVHAPHVHDILKQFERYRFTPEESTPPDGLGLYWELKQRYGSEANVLLLIQNAQRRLATLRYERRPGNPSYLQVARNYMD
jgi:hypothetical protein